VVPPVSSLLHAAGAAAALDVEVHGGAPQGGDRLLRDYLAGAAALRPFYAGHPGDGAAFERKAAEVDGRMGADVRARVADAIEPLGDAASRLRRIMDGDGYFVTTGQQPALFGGPLYTLYKTLAAIRLAGQLEQRLGRPVLALFWVGADDHDWDEANHASLLDRHGDLQTIRIRGAADAPPLPLSERRWGPDIVRAVDEFVSLLPDTVHADAVREHLRAEYTADATVATSFTATFRMLLRDQRIAMVSSAHPALRRAAAPVIRREAERTEEHAALVRRQTGRLVAAGYTAQVAVADDASNLMLLDENGRDRLVRGRRGWQTRRVGTHMDEQSLLRAITAEPERFSPNVLLRPVVENAVFPTIAYVAGPGEVRYFAQIGCLFRAHGILPPVVVPRPSATMVERKVRRALDRLGLEPDSLRRPLDELVAEQARSAMPPPVAAALAQLRESLGARYADLVDAAAPVDAALDGPLRSARNRSLRQVAEAETRILRALKRRDAARLEQLRRAVASLQPRGVPQERVHGPLPYLAAHGPALVPALAAVLEPTFAAVGGSHATGCDE
jgi:bacillithiol synthase